MTVKFACGHHQDVPESIDQAPVCATCGERRVSRVDAPKPRFRGIATGPCAVKE